jgi:hypothetical protein
VQELVFARARKAVRAIRAQAAKTGSDGLTPAEIDREVNAARRARRRKGRRG